MKVLVISPVLPWPLSTGYRVRAFNMIQELATEHHITLVTPFDWTTRKHVDEAKIQFGQLGVSLQLVEMPNRGLLSRIAVKVGFLFLHYTCGVSRAEYYYNLWPFGSTIRGFIEQNTYEVIITNYWFTLPNIMQKAPVASICETIDVFSEQLERQLMVMRLRPWERWAATRSLKRFRSRETNVLNSYDVLICTTERDASILRETRGVKTKAVVIETLRSKERIPYECRILFDEKVLFFGALCTKMNIDAAHYAAKEIFPRVRRRRPNARLVIAGSDPDSSTRELAEIDGVDVIADLSLSALVETIHQARVILLPLRIGSGIKGRVLEAMEAGTPIVGSSIAAEGIPASHMKTMLISNDPDELAALTTRMLTDDNLRSRISKEARAFVEDTYSWARTYGKIHECLRFAKAAHSKRVTIRE